MYFTIASGDKNCKCHNDCDRPSGHGHTAYEIGVPESPPPPPVPRPPPAPKPRRPPAPKPRPPPPTPKPSPPPPAPEPSPPPAPEPSPATDSADKSPEPSPPSDASDDATGCTEANKDQWLELLNAKRADHGACPLKWNCVMEEDVRAWLKTLEPGPGHLEHCYEPDGTPCGYVVNPPHGPCGENLAWQMPAAPAEETIPKSVEGWYSEVNNCAKSIAEDGCQEGKSQQKPTGHFTAMVWKGAAEVGCAVVGEYSGCRLIEANVQGKSCNTPNMGGCYTSNVGG